MNRIKTVLSIVAVGAVLVLANGCAINKDNEDLLAKAGFKMMPATTKAQQEHLKTLPVHTISEVQRNGKMYFVYPDVDRKVLYVGQAEQYQKYQKLLEERSLQEQQMNTQMMNESKGFVVWGPDAWQ